MGSNLKLPFCKYRDSFTGWTDASVELVEYGDFQCDHCADIYVCVKLLQEHLGNALKFVFRHYPLHTFHPLALDAAVATEAAALQGKFWYMHDMIFENRKYLSRNSFSKFAGEIGLDIKAFENSRERKKLIQKVVNDFESGVKSGVNGTPTFFINGTKYNGIEDFKNIFNSCRQEEIRVAAGSLQYYKCST